MVGEVTSLRYLRGRRNHHFLRSLAKSEPTPPSSPSPTSYLYDYKKEEHTQISLLVFAEPEGDSDLCRAQCTLCLNIVVGVRDPQF